MISDKTERIKSLSEEKLIDVVKNYRQYGYGEDLRNLAIETLKERGIDEEFLRLTGNLENQTYNSAEDLSKSFKKNSKIAFILYAMLLCANIGAQLITSYAGFLGTIVEVSYLCLFVLYFFFLIRSFVNHYQFYKAIGRDFGIDIALLYLFVGMPFYIIMYFYFRNQMNEQMKMIR